MRNLHFQLSLKRLFAFFSFAAFGFWFALPFRPSIEISDFAIENGAVDQTGTLTVSAKVTNRGYGTVYLQSAGDSFDALSMVSYVKVDSDTEGYWLPYWETRLIRPNSLQAYRKLSWQPVRSRQSITIRNSFIRSQPTSQTKMYLSIVDWRGRTARIESKPFDLKAIPSLE